MSNLKKMLGKIGLNAEAKEISEMEQIPVDVYQIKEHEGSVWVGLEIN